MGRRREPTRGGGGAKLFALMRRGEGAKAVTVAMITKRKQTLRRVEAIDAASYGVLCGSPIYIDSVLSRV